MRLFVTSPVGAAALLARILTRRWMASVHGTAQHNAWAAMVADHIHARGRDDAKAAMAAAIAAQRPTAQDPATRRPA